MTEKNRGKDDQESWTDQSHDTTSKRARARRLVLKSIVTGGAATTVKTLPEKWTRPITESVLLPAHAQVSAWHGALSCQVGSLSFSIVNTDDDDGVGLVGAGHYTSGPPFNGGSSTVVDQLLTQDYGNQGDGYPIDGALNIVLNSVSVTLDPATSEEVTVQVSGGGDFTPNAPTTLHSTTNTGGVANFGGINGNMSMGDVVVDGDNSDSLTGNLKLQFSAPGASPCVINFSFMEGPVPI